MTPPKRTGTRTAPRRAVIEPPSPAFVPPYPPSWIDRLLWAIDRWPWPPWGGFVALALASIGLGLLYLRLIGQQSSPTMFVLLAAPLAIIRYLDSVALRSLDRFRPALAASPEELRRLAYELTTMSRAAGRWLVLASVVLVVIAYNAYPTDFPELAGFPWYVLVPLLVLYGLGSSTYLALPVYAVRQLRLVSQIHRGAPHINLLQPTPLYAFSALTVRAGIGLLVLIYAGWLSSDPTARSGSFILFGPMVLAATGAFVLPLYGMHVRLAQQKERLLAEHQARLDAAMNSLHHMVEKPNSARADALYKVISSLMIEREILAKAPTWPWRPGTWGSFASAVVLPIAILLISRLLERISP